MGKTAKEKRVSEVAVELTKELIDKGLIIEAGWTALKFITIPDNAPEIQVEEMRVAFFAGAHHLFNSLMTCLEEGKEATDLDLNRLTLISKELESFTRDFRFKYLTKPEGSA